MWDTVSNLSVSLQNMSTDFVLWMFFLARFMPGLPCVIHPFDGHALELGSRVVVLPHDPRGCLWRRASEADMPGLPDFPNLGVSDAERALGVCGETRSAFLRTRAEWGMDGAWVCKDGRLPRSSSEVPRPSASSRGEVITLTFDTSSFSGCINLIPSRFLFGTRH